jgi:hypothetical protein
MIVKLGERVRIRLVNLGMDHHPMHIHGNQFYVTGTEGGRTPESAWFPGNTVLVGVAQARDIEFDAIFAGDWMLHCHLPHHMMNQMVSMVGPMAHVGHGMHTGMGMEEGMGIVRQDHAISEELGPSLGRSLGVAATREKETSNMVAQHEQHAAALDQEAKKRVPGYPQDDMMIMMQMDEAVAKPETYGLAPGWSASVMGMMTLVRVLPPDLYEEVMTRVREGRVEPPQQQPGHKHEHEE